MTAIVLPWPPSILSGHAKGNGRWEKIRVTNKLRGDAERLTLAVAADISFADGDIPITIRFEPPNRRGDRCNFAARAKPLIDGVADALGVNDARFLPTYEFGEPFAGGRVVVTIGGA